MVGTPPDTLRAIRRLCPPYASIRFDATPAAMTGGVQSHIPAVASCSYPARAGNAVRPLVDGVPAYRRICEAVMAARHSVWLTVTFFAPEFQMPDGAGSLFDVLDRAVARGLDVRIMFWRPNPESVGYGRAFAGSPEECGMLATRGSRFRIRWDRAHGPYCQHQKNWVIDAGQASETAFVGGMNMTTRAGSPGHAAEGEWHDVYVEVAGPSATDVHHNFVQRWNEASERTAVDGTWGHDGDDELSFPARLSDPRGNSVVQIQRTVHAGRYGDAHPSPDSRPFDIAGGERSILAQYHQAIAAARSISRTRPSRFRKSRRALSKLSSAVWKSCFSLPLIWTKVPAPPVRIRNEKPCSTAWHHSADMRTSRLPGLRARTRRGRAAASIFMARSC
jgi:phosphatidylserine/phosphatidylglycerophosphate/cardiolipin synthase-like enzyme